MNPIGPSACYDEGKRCEEALAVSYARQYGPRCASRVVQVPLPKDDLVRRNPNITLAQRNESSTPAVSLKLGPKFVRGKSFAPIQRTSGFLETGFFLAGKGGNVVYRLQDVPSGG